MRGRLLRVLPLALLVSTPVLGCGDKFLLASRGIRSLRGSMAAHPSSILIYRNPNSIMPAVEREMRLQSTLSLAGHKTSSVENPATLNQALKSGKYDLVLADVSDAATVKDQIGLSSPTTVLLPILNPKLTDRKTAAKEYGWVLMTSDNSGHLLASIDDALEARTRATSRIR